MGYFFNADENLALVDSHLCNSLIKGETKKMSHRPIYSDDGRIEVIVNGKSVDEKDYNGTFSIRNSVKK